jgi:hypothetical protein
MEDLPAVQAARVKQLLHAHLSKNGVYDRIRGIVSAADSSDNTAAADKENSQSSSDLIALLHKEGVIGELIESLSTGDVGGDSAMQPTQTTTTTTTTSSSLLDNANSHASASSSSSSTSSVVPMSGATSVHAVRAGRRYLLLRLNSGKAFVDALIDDGLQSASPASFTVSLLFRGRRFRSRAAAACVEPQFDDVFALPLQEDDASPLLSMDALLCLNEPVTVCVTRTDRRGATTLVCSAGVVFSFSFLCNAA